MSIKIYNSLGDEIFYDSFNFSAGEVNVRVNSDSLTGDPVRLHAKLTDSNEVIKLIMLKDALDRLGCPKVSLTLDYFPYSRQDRVCNKGEAFSLKVFANLINSCHFHEVKITDPHSDVTPALLDNVCVYSFSKFLMGKVKKNFNPYTTALVSPDAGASKKIQTFAKEMSSLYNWTPKAVIKSDKVRDVSTGKLQGCEVYSNDLTMYEDVIIVDDICDGGGTFIMLADKLKELGAKRIHLFVSHGIFSKGFDVFEGKIDSFIYKSIFEEK